MTFALAIMLVARVCGCGVEWGEREREREWRVIGKFVDIYMGFISMGCMQSHG